MNHKILAAACILALSWLSPDAFAVPAFARQTGMACYACHFQSFPVLTNFGKTFKMSGYTLMGAQSSIEGDENLSIPSNLNMAVILKARYEKTNGPESTFPGYNSNNGRYDLPDEFALFAAGRVSENIGALVEISIAGAEHAGVANFKMPFIHDLGHAYAGIVPFSGDAGVAYGFDLFGTGSNTTGRVIENGQGYSAARYLNTHTEVTGLALYLANEDFHVNLTPWAQGSQVSASGATEATALGGNYLRAAWTPTVGGWDLGVGVQHFSGNSYEGMNNVNARLHRDEATIADFQGQGMVAGMPLGIYGSYGYAEGSTAAENAACIAASPPLPIYPDPPLPQFTGCNSFNDGTSRRSAFGLLAELGVIPEQVSVQLGFMRAYTGKPHPALMRNESDNGTTLGLRYKMRQNVYLSAAYTKYSGMAYSPDGSKDASAQNALGDSVLNVTLFTGF